MRTPRLIDPQVLDAILFNAHVATGPALFVAEDILDYVEALPPNLRRLVEGCYWEQKSVSMLAQELGVDKSAAHRLLRAARDGLREFLRVRAEEREAVRRASLSDDRLDDEGDVVAVRVPLEDRVGSPGGG